MEKRFKLPRAFALNWIAALKSHRYRQTCFQLYDSREEAYDCLGVACHLMDVEDLDSAAYIPASHDPRFAAIPKELRGLNNLTSELIDLNDKPTSLKDIAAWIEQNVELYEDEQD